MKQNLEFLNVTDLAICLGLSPSTIRYYRCKNPTKLPPAYNLTGRPLWKKTEVEAWIRTRREAVND